MTAGSNASGRAHHRLGLIGCGDIALTAHLPAVSRSKECSLEIVCDLDPHSAREAARAFGIPNWTTSIDAVLAHDIDGVIVATPPTATPEIVAATLTAGIPTLCEKPIATDPGAARSLSSAAEQTATPCQVGYKNRFAPPILELRAWLEDRKAGHGDLARVSSFDEVWSPAMPDDGSFDRIAADLEAASPMVHEGTHHLDLLIWLFGPVERILSASSLRAPEGQALGPSYVLAHLMFERGQQATVEVGWCFPHSIKGEFQLWTPSGFAEVSRSRRSLETDDGVSNSLTTFTGEWQAACFDGQLTAFLGLIDGLQSTGATIEEAIAVLELAAEIDRLSGWSHN